MKEKQTQLDASKAIVTNAHDRGGEMAVSVVVASSEPVEEDPEGTVQYEWISDFKVGQQECKEQGSGRLDEVLLLVEEPERENGSNGSNGSNGTANGTAESASASDANGASHSKGRSKGSATFKSIKTKIGMRKLTVLSDGRKSIEAKVSRR
jgi:hypothetical protein